MRKEELIKQLKERAPLLANAVSHMVTYVQDRYPSTFPSKEQTEAVNNYLRSVHADGDGSTSERNCEHRRIASQNITIAAIRVLDSQQLDRLQNVLDHIAYDKEYYMPLTFSFGCTIYKPSSKLTDDENKLELLYSAFVRTACISGRKQIRY